MVISHWSSDVCSSDLFFGDIAKITVEGFRNDVRAAYRQTGDAPTDAYLSDLEAQISINSKITRRKHRMFNVGAVATLIAIALFSVQIGRATCRERVCQ